jgi:hypothetical protein
MMVMPTGFGLNGGEGDSHRCDDREKFEACS